MFIHSQTNLSQTDKCNNAFSLVDTHNENIFFNVGIRLRMTRCAFTDQLTGLELLAVTCGFFIFGIPHKCFQKQRLLFSLSTSANQILTYPFTNTSNNLTNHSTYVLSSTYNQHSLVDIQ